MVPVILQALGPIYVSMEKHISLEKKLHKQLNVTRDDTNVNVTAINASVFTTFDLSNSLTTPEHQIVSTSEKYTVTTVDSMTKLTLAKNIVSALTNTEEVTDMKHHWIMLMILICVFMVISLALSVAIIVFCKKKNSVFVLQKSEQESEFEMDDMNTEIETSDTEYDDLSLSKTKRSQTYPNICKYSSTNENRPSNRKEAGVNGSPSSIPLLQGTSQQSPTGSPTHDFKSSIYKSQNCAATSLTKSNTFANHTECQKLLTSSKRKRHKNHGNTFGSLLLTKLTPKCQNETSSDTPNVASNSKPNRNPSQTVRNSKSRTEQILVVETEERDHGLSNDETYNFEGTLEIL